MGGVGGVWGWADTHDEPAAARRGFAPLLASTTVAEAASR